MKKKMSILLPVVVLLICAFSLTACSGGATPTEDRPVPTGAEAVPLQEETPPPEPIIIGAVVSHTGYMAAYDIPPYEGAELAVKVLNEKGGILGKPVEIRQIDGKTDAATIGNAARQLIEGGADFIMAPCDFDVGSQASIAAQEFGLVGVSTCASSPLYNSIVLGDKQFTVHMWNNNQAAGGVEYAFDELGWRKAYFIVDTSAESMKSMRDYWTAHWDKMGGVNLGEDTYLSGDMDFSAQIQRIRALPEEPDGLFIALSMPDVGTIIRQVRSSGIDLPIMGFDAFDTTEFYEIVGEDLGNEIYFTTQSWIGPEMGENMVDFIELFEEEYGRKPDIGYIATGWDVIVALAEAIEIAGTTDGQAVAKVMEEHIFLDLLGGALDWTSADEGHEPLREVTIVKSSRGIPSFVIRVKPESPPAP